MEEELHYNIAPEQLALDAMDFHKVDGTKVTFVRRDFFENSCKKFIKQLITEGKLTITSGFEEYFKSIDDELEESRRRNDAGGLPGLDQGKVPGDSEVQQGDNGTGSRDSEGGQQVSGTRESQSSSGLNPFDGRPDSNY